MSRITLFPCLLWLLPAFFSAGCSEGESSKDATQVDTLPMLVMQIQKCSRLYTTEYVVHKIVTYDDVVSLRGEFLSKSYDVALPFGDRKVAIPMDATLKAYIDFSGFSRENVSREGGKLVVTLPDPRVVMTASKVDQQGVREYVSLMRAHFSDRELASFEQQGREAIIASIPKMGIIEAARASAARQLVPIFVRMGYREEDVSVAFSRDFKPSEIRTLVDINSMER